MSYGRASDLVPSVDISVLSVKGSLFVTRPHLATYIGSQGDLLQTNHLFKVATAGALKIRVNHTVLPAEVAAAILRWKRTVPPAVPC